MNESIEIINSKRKELALKLANRGFVVIPLYEPSVDQPQRSKIPCIKDWTKRTVTTATEVEQWFSTHPYRNSGMVLGSASGVVAIDVDGEGGYAILQELSGGDIPKTVSFATGGGGLRYIYKIPQAYKERAFKKFSISNKDEPHTECALLGDGQQTVLPFSIHPNGKVYEFCEGMSFDEIELADAPAWMVEKMTYQETLTTVIPALQTAKTLNQKVAPLPPDRLSISAELLETQNRCECLKHSFNEQASSGLSEDKWYLIMNLLVSCGSEDLAMEFSKASHKHNERSEERIALLTRDRDTNKKKTHIRCLTLGCGQEKIVACMGYAYANSNGEITNSPAKRIKKDIIQNMKIGFHYDSKGIFTGINGNIFARHILKHYSIRMKVEGIYYIYKDNYWKKVDKNYIQKLLYKFFDNYEKDKWTAAIEAIYLEALKRLCDNVEELEPSTDYICMTNGLFNIKTLQLEAHTKNVFSTTQVPIKYDDTKNCPTFMAFIDDIFDNDLQLVCLVQEIIGYCLCPHTKAQMLFMFLGEGANGKSLLCEIIIALIGVLNVSAIPLSGLSKDSKMAQIVDKALNVSTESDMRIDSANIQLLKAISAGDTIQINQKYEPTYSYKPYAKLIFCTNRLPSIADRSYGFNRRLIIIPFNKTYYSNPKDNTQPKADKSLLEKILPELDGIFNFAIDGLKRLRDNDYTFSYSEKAEKLLEEYKLDINPYLDFVGFAIEEGSYTDKIDVKKLHEVFVQWCRECNHSQLSNVTIRTFLREIRVLFKSESITYREGKSNGSNFFYNIKFTAEGKKELHIVTPNPSPITLPKPPNSIPIPYEIPVSQK